MKEDTTVEFDQKIYDKWEKTGLMKGIDDPDLQRKVSTLLENQAKYILQIAKDPRDGKEMQENPSYQLALNIVFPIIRRIFGGTGENAFKLIDGDWDVMSMPYQTFDGDMISATTRKLVTKADFKVNEDICSYHQMCPDISMLHMLQTMMRREFEEMWKNQKVWVYVPFQPILFRPGRTIGFVTRYGCRGKQEMVNEHV